ncbi:MAG: BrnA antitoxin family protein [Spirochaetaceae bacterium]|nr:BrnA antitoxin family protein [Spirochaetaceae bacterium]
MVHCRFTLIPWKAQGKGYQTRINAILRAAVLGRASPSPQKRETASRLPCNSLPHGNTLVCCCNRKVPVAIVLEEHTVASSRSQPSLL